MVVDRYAIEVALPATYLEELSETHGAVDNVLSSAEEKLVLDVIQRFNSANVGGVRRTIIYDSELQLVRCRFEVDTVLTDLPEGAD